MLNENRTESALIPDARERIEKALLEYCKKHNPKKRKDLFEPGIAALNLTKEQKRDKSSDSVYTKYKSLVGTIINELLLKGSISLSLEDPMTPVLAEPVVSEEDLFKKKKRTIQDFLFKKYLTEAEMKDRSPNSKAVIIKKLLNEKHNVELIKTRPLDDVEREIERQLKKIIEIKEDRLYPLTPIGNCLRNQREKFIFYKQNKISKAAYIKSLKDTLIEAINLLGGVHFSAFSLKLIKAAYGDRVIYDSITEGANDRGIDAYLICRDEIGFEEKIVIQAKIKKNQEASIGEKVMREFYGSLELFGANKGILITNANIHKDARDVVKNKTNIMCVDKDKLFELMQTYKVGVRFEDGIPCIDDDLFLIR